jgi:hypothetical protein
MRAATTRPTATALLGLAALATACVDRAGSADEAGVEAASPCIPPGPDAPPPPPEPTRTPCEVRALSDGVLTARTVFTHDSAGNPVRVEYDTDADGIPDRVDTSTFDARGNVVLHRTEDAATDAPITLTEQRWDAGDRLVRSRAWEEGSPIPDWAYIAEYDPAGRLLMQESRVEEGTWRELATYDDAGLLVAFVREDDSRSDGVLDWRTESTFECGRMVRQETFSGPALELISTRFWTRHADGRPARTETVDAAGVLHGWSRWRYDESDRPIEYVRTDPWDPATPVVVWTRRYEGDLVIETTGAGEAGANEATRDAAGRLVRVAWDWDGDGHFEEVESVRFDAEGRVVEWHSRDVVVTYTYDADHNPIRTEQHGTDRWALEYDYGCWD